MYTFNDFNLRAATEADREHCEQWIAADPDHAGKVKADFFIKSTPASECLILEDKFGEPIFYFRQERALRIHIQFGPAFTSEERKRNLDGMRKGFTWLTSRARHSGFRQIIFQSTVAPLIQVCKKRFGFEDSQNELVSCLAPLTPEELQENALHPVQHDSQEGS